jgi:hypothetical protein
MTTTITTTTITTANPDSALVQVLNQPFELKEVRPGFDSGIGDDSLETGDISITTREATSSPPEKLKGASFNINNINNSNNNGNNSNHHRATSTMCAVKNVMYSSFSPGINSRLSPSGKQVCENGVQTVEAVSAISRTSPTSVHRMSPSLVHRTSPALVHRMSPTPVQRTTPPALRQELKRKGDSLDSIPARPPSRRNRLTPTENVPTVSQA